MDYLFTHYSPYKAVPNEPIKRILLGMYTIDRDVNKAQLVWDSIQSSIIMQDISFVVITRETDIYSIEFWKDKSQVIMIPHYDIVDRHSFPEMAKQCNLLVKIAIDNGYDALAIVESDVVISETTLSLLISALDKNHVALVYGVIPWADTPIVVVPGLLGPKFENPRNGANKLIIGSWMGCVMFRVSVFNDVYFDVDSIQSPYGVIDGQDVSIYKQLFYHRYKVFLVDQEVKHDFA